MEYEKLYLKTFNEVHSNTENYIKNELIEYINKDFEFNKVSNEILEESRKKFETNKFNTTNPYTDLIYIFNNERKKYSKNFNENVFKRDVKPVFDNLQINEYSFEDLIKDLAEYYSETDTYRIFRNENRLFELIYKSEDFSRFEIKEYDTVLENTEIFNYYRGLVYPESKQIKESSIDKSIEISKEKYKHDFEIDEQALVLNLCLADKNSIPLTEKIKLLILIGEIKDKTIFSEDITNNQFYHKANKGIYRRGSTKTMIENINSILNKIENEELNITNQTLKKHRTTLISEQNNMQKI
jgi:hypothetical protein